MKKFMILGVALAALALCGAPAKAALTVDTVTVSMNAGPEIDQDTGYMGTFTWVTHNTSFTAASYVVFYQINLNTGDGTGFNLYSAGQMVDSAPNGSYTHSVDFATSNITVPTGTYNITLWVCAGNATTFSAVLATIGGGDDTSAMIDTPSVPPYTVPGCDDDANQSDPLPQPEPPPPPDPGNDPPIVYPALPTSGPPGPGSISMNRYYGE